MALRSMMENPEWNTIARKVQKVQEITKIQEENKCKNCKEEGHKHWHCTKGDICRICKNEGHIAKDCPTSTTCRHCNKKGHLERKCWSNPDAIKIKDTQTNQEQIRGKGTQEGITNENEGNWEQWASQRALREAMGKKNKRTVVTLQTECQREKRKPTKKEIKKILKHRKVDIRKVIGVITRVDRAEIFFGDVESAEGFLFEYVIRAGPDIWAISARIGNSNTKRVIFKEVPWNVTDETILKYANIWGTPQAGKEGKYITYERETLDEDGTKWLTGNRILMMILKRQIPRKNIIQGNMVAVEYPGQQECYRCKDTPEKCPGKGRAKDCSDPQASWKDKLRERLKVLKYDLTDMETGGQEEMEEDGEKEGMEHETEEKEEEEIEKLEDDEHLEEIKVIGMKNIEKEILWELLKSRLKKAAEEIQEKEGIEAEIDNKKKEYDAAYFEFEHYKGRAEWGNMTIRSDDEDLLRGLWMGILLMKDALEIKLIPKYRNNQMTPAKKATMEDLTPMEKLEKEIRTIKENMKRVEEEEKKKEDDGKGGNENQNQEPERPPPGEAKEIDQSQTKQVTPEKKGSQGENPNLTEATSIDTHESETEDMEQDNQDRKIENSVNETPRGRNRERGIRCGKCKECTSRCTECDECTRMAAPGQKRKPCKQRGQCSTPRDKSRVISVKRGGENLDEQRDVKSKINKLEGKSEVTPLQSQGEGTG